MYYIFYLTSFHSITVIIEYPCYKSMCDLLYTIIQKYTQEILLNSD